MAQPLIYGKYQLLELIARGGMAEVFKAKSHGVEGFEKVVVIKRILPEFGENSDFVEMFVNEAKIAVTLSHANIVQVFDLGRTEDTYFIAMEFVHGFDLAAVMARTQHRAQQVPVELAVYVVSEVAKGLDYAHRRKDHNLRPLGIVHRDISPQNILISFEGEVKITDFGIAAARGAIGEDDGMVKGKCMYMAPEQARGGDVDGRADIYSVGVVLYELLAGRNPHQGGTEHDVLRRVQAADYRPLAEVAPHVPPDLARIVQHAMAVEPDDRYPNAARLFEDLVAFLYTTGRRVGVHDLAQFVQGLRQATGEVPLPEGESLREAFGLGSRSAVRPLPSGQITSVQVPSASTPPPSTEEAPASQRLPTERRDVTALAFELLGEAPPPELIADLEALVEREGGRVVESRSDFGVALFGLDHSDGRDTEAALACGLKLQRLVSGAQDRAPGCKVGVGIHPAKIVMVAGGAPREEERYYALLGAARELAARGAGLVVASPAARRIAKEHFEFQELGGGDFVVLAKRPLADVYGRFVGRSRELRLIGDELAQVSQGAARALLLLGEPGTGKTRLLHETRKRLVSGGHEFNWYQVRCASQLRTVPNSALAAMIRAVLALEETDPPAKVREQVERLRELGVGTQEIEAVAQLLGLPSSRAEQGGGELARQVSVALVRMATKLSEDRITVFVWDAAEDIDSDSFAAVGALARRDLRARVLAILAGRARPRFEWEPAPSLTEIELAPLSDADAMKLALARLRASDVPLALLNEIADKTGGNPLYVEEYVKALLDSGAVEVKDRRVAYHPQVAEIEVPKSLRGLLGARVERLGEHLRGLLQRAAVLAPAFSVELLAAMSEADVEGVRAGVDELVREGILSRTGAGEYGFVNDMLREIVYDGITFADRKEIHGRVAAAMERLYQGRLEEVHERLAVHYRESGQREKAIEFLVKAGEKLAKENAHEAALMHYLRAVDLLQNVPRPDLGRVLDAYRMVGAAAIACGKVGLGMEKMRLAVELSEDVGDRRAAVGLLTLMGRLLVKATRFGEAQTYFARALELSTGLTDERIRRDILGAIGEALSRNGEYRQATQYLEEALQLARSSADKKIEAGLLRELSHCWAARGRAEKAIDCLEQSAAAAEESGDKLLVCEVWKSRGLVHYMLRDPEEALKASSRALEMGKEYGFAYEVAVNSHNIGDLQIRLGNYQAAFAALRFSHETARQHGFSKLEALNMMLLGFIDAVKFHSRQGLERIEQALEFAEGHGYTWDVIQAKYFLAQAHAELGNAEKARLLLREALGLARATDNRLYIDDCQRLLERLE